MFDHELKHYQQHLKNLITNDKTVHVGKDILKKDLKDNVKEANDAADYVTGATPLTSQAFRRRKAIIESALTCYISDLEKSKMHCAKKGNAVSNLESDQREIQVAEFHEQSLL